MAFWKLRSKPGMLMNVTKCIQNGVGSAMEVKKNVCILRLDFMIKNIWQSYKF